MEYEAGSVFFLFPSSSSSHSTLLVWISLFVFLGFVLLLWNGSDGVCRYIVIKQPENPHHLSSPSSFYCRYYDCDYRYWHLHRWTPTIITRVREWFKWRVRQRWRKQAGCHVMQPGVPDWLFICWCIYLDAVSCLFSDYLRPRWRH